jgi:hypothetical protein
MRLDELPWSAPKKRHTFRGFGPLAVTDWYCVAEVKGLVVVHLIHENEYHLNGGEEFLFFNIDALSAQCLLHFYLGGNDA